MAFLATQRRANATAAKFPGQTQALSTQKQADPARPRSRFWYATHLVLALLLVGHLLLAEPNSLMPFLLCAAHTKDTADIILNTAERRNSKQPEPDLQCAPSRELANRIYCTGCAPPPCLISQSVLGSWVGHKTVSKESCLQAVHSISGLSMGLVRRLSRSPWQQQTV